MVDAGPDPTHEEKMRVPPWGWNVALCDNGSVTPWYHIPPPLQLKSSLQELSVQNETEGEIYAQNGHHGHTCRTPEEC